MHVIATAGHVDHGKSALVRAITGMEPDRWAEERRRGMTIDLGYAWSTLPSGTELAFVDVPGHQRFIGNMLAGLGPAPAVLFVVAADQGWSRQPHEHLAAINGLELAHGVLAITRSDLADPHNATSEAIDHLAASSLGRVDAVAVSATTGQGLPELLTALDRLVDKLPQPLTTGRVRLWIDRAFAIRGSGTVVTGTLGEGRLSVGDELELDGQLVRVRSLQRLGKDTSTVSAVARVAVNLRSVKPDQVHRGAALITPERWRHTSTLDVRSDRTEPLATQLVLHLGTASVAVRTRQLGGNHHRLHLQRALPIRVGDRALLRDPSTASIAAAVQVLDTTPPALSRRGDGRRRAEELATATAQDNPAAEVHRRGAVLRRDLELDGAELSPEIKNAGDWLVSPRLWAGWLSALSAAVDTHSQQSPLAPRCRSTPPVGWSAPPTLPLSEPSPKKPTSR